MPLYDYKCTGCGKEREVQHSMSEIGKIEIKCEACAQPMKKLLSAPTLLGFDNVGRSISKKDKKDTPKNEAPKKETSKASDSKKSAA
jgi:putative FmdB family regulatory protein